jgi:hypothetical protein
MSVSLPQRRDKLINILQNEITKLNNYRNRLAVYCKNCPVVIKSQNLGSRLREILFRSPEFLPVTGKTILPACENLYCIVDETVTAYTRHVNNLLQNKVSVQKHAGVVAEEQDLTVSNLQDLEDDIIHRNKISMENLEKLVKQYEVEHTLPRKKSTVIIVITALVILLILILILMITIYVWGIIRISNAS